MKTTPGLHFAEIDNLKEGNWIINPFCHIDNFKVSSIGSDTYGRYQRIVVKGCYQGSDVVQTRHYAPGDKVVTAEFNPMVNFKENTKAAREWGYEMKLRASTDKQPSGEIDFLFKPALNAAGQVNSRYTAPKEDGFLWVEVSKDDGGYEMQQWKLSDCRFLNDNIFRSTFLPVDGEAVSLRNSVRSINEIMTQENIDNFTLFKAIAIASGATLKGLEIAGHMLRVEGKDNKGDGFSLTVNKDGKLSYYSNKSPMPQIAKAIMEGECDIIPSQSLQDLFKSCKLEFDMDSKVLRYSNRSYGYHYNGMSPDADSGIGDVIKYIKDKLKSHFDVEKISHTTSSEYGIVDFDIDDLIPGIEKKDLVTTSKSGYFINSIDSLIFQWRNENPDFSVNTGKMEFYTSNFSELNDGDLSEIVNLNKQCLQKIEEKMLKIHKERILAFTKAELIAGSHVDNFGIENLKTAQNSINNYIDQAKNAGIVKDTKDEPGLSM